MHIIHTNKYNFFPNKQYKSLKTACIVNDGTSNKTALSSWYQAFPLL